MVLNTIQEQGSKRGGMQMSLVSVWNQSLLQKCSLFCRHWFILLGSILLALIYNARPNVAGIRKCLSGSPPTASSAVFSPLDSSRSCFLIQYSSRSHRAPCSCAAVPKVLSPLEVRNLGSYAKAVKLLDQLVLLFRTVWMSLHSNTWCLGSEDAVVALWNSPGSEWKVVYYWVREEKVQGVVLLSASLSQLVTLSWACMG